MNSKEGMIAKWRGQYSGQRTLLSGSRGSQNHPKGSNSTDGERWPALEMDGRLLELPVFECVEKWLGVVDVKAY